MSEIDQLRIEVRRLFEEANNAPGGLCQDNKWRFYNSGPASVNSFKYRLKELRQRAVSLKLITTPPVQKSTRVRAKSVL